MELDMKSLEEKLDHLNQSVESIQRQLAFSHHDTSELQLLASGLKEWVVKSGLRDTLASEIGKPCNQYISAVLQVMVKPVLGKDQTFNKAPFDTIMYGLWVCRSKHMHHAECKVVERFIKEIIEHVTGTPFPNEKSFIGLLAEFAELHAIWGGRNTAEEKEVVSLENLQYYNLFLGWVESARPDDKWLSKVPTLANLALKYWKDKPKTNSPSSTLPEYYYDFPDWTINPARVLL